MSTVESVHTFRQRGAAMIWVAVTSSALIAMVAFVIDLSRKQVVARQIQTAVDAISLGGANRLDGSRNGWIAARRNAIALFRQQQIMGISNATLQTAKFNNASLGPEDILETDPRYTVGTARLGDIQIKIERGIFPWPDAAGKETFLSLEGQPLLTSAGEEIPAFNQLPVYLIANAVRVEVKILRLGATFGKIMGFNDLGVTVRDGIAAREASLQEIPAAPFAIPACSLFLDGDPRRVWESGYDFFTDRYKPDEQCEREVVISEADPLRSTDLLDGRIRAAAYVRPPTYAHPGDSEDACYSKTAPEDPQALNCRKAVPIYATFGVPANADDQSISPASLYEVSQAIGNPGGTVSMKLGNFFRAYESPNITSDPAIPNLVLNLSRLLNGSSEKLTTGTKGFPYLTGLVPERDRANRMGPYLVDLWDPAKDATLPVGATDYRNPLCSSKTVGPYAMKTLKVPVVAPRASGVNYCDFNDLFHPVPQNSKPITIDTEPVILGFINLELFDFNFAHLGDFQTNLASIPSRKIPPDYMEPRLRFFEKKDSWKPYVSFIIEHVDFFTCAMRPSCDFCQISPLTPGCDDCRSFDCHIPPSSDLISEHDYKHVLAKHFYLPTYEAAKTCLVDHNILGCVFLGVEWLFGSGSNWGNPKDPDIRSLAYKKVDCPDSTSFQCWDLPQPRSLEYGCAAARARIKCSSSAETFFSSGTPLEESRTVLVKKKE